VSDDGFRLAHPARAIRRPFGQRSCLGAYEGDATVSELLEVGPGGGISEHLVVHAGGQEEWSGPREKECGENIVGQPLGKARDQVRGCRRHDDYIGLMTQPKM
jgi:hypothetical protein